MIGEIKHYLGIEVKKNDDGNFMLSQTAYINRVVSEFGLTSSKCSPYPMIPDYYKTENAGSEFLQCNQSYRKLIGSLLYIGTNTRPDIVASVSILARKVEAPTQNDLNEAKRTLKYLKGTSEHQLELGNRSDDLFIGYADADYAEDQTNRKSNSGFIFFVYGSPVNWTCKKQSCVSLASSEAEYVSLAEACTEAVWLSNVLKGFNLPMEPPIVIREDNQSSIRMAEQLRPSNRSKHIDVKYHYIRELVQTGQIKLEYCPTESMLAAMLTKPLAARRLQKLRELCGMIVH